MSTALVGEIYSQENRAKMFSIIFAVPPIITVFGSPLIAYIGDWRRALLLFAIPIAITSLVLVKLNIPPLKARKEISLVSAFKMLATNVSAISCLANFFLSSITWQIIGVLSISFLREYHQLPRETTSLIYSGFALAVFLGALSGGKIVEYLGI
jgi:predicted MFS family arabinose efflux permease